MGAENASVIIIRGKVKKITAFKRFFFGITYFSCFSQPSDHSYSIIKEPSLYHTMADAY